MSVSFTEEFFSQEKRRNFVVGEVMKRAWAVDLTIIDDIVKISNENSLKIFACYGTLLGAVRERGFIPWDDDVDLGLVGDDYVRFLEIITNEYAEKYNTINPYTKTWYCMNFTHISNNRKSCFERKYLEKWYGCPFMRGVDIFPYYYIPRNPVEEEYIVNILKKIDYAISLAESDETGKKGISETLAAGLVELQHETGYVFGTDRPLDNQLEILYDQVCRITKEEDADFVARYDEYTRDKSKKFPKEMFQYSYEMPFENIRIPVPIGYDRILKARFGESYIMPRQETGAHEYPYYKKQLNDEKYHNIQLKYMSEISTLIRGERISRDKEKLTCIYHTSAREMLINSDSAARKIRKALEFFERNEVAVKMIWIADYFLKNDDYALDLLAPNLIEEYEEIIKKYSGENGVFCAVDTPLNEIVENSDIYYGDEGIYAEAFRNAGKKVFIQDYSEDAVEIAGELGADEGKKENPRISIAENKSSLRKSDIPEEWKKFIITEDGNKKKVILYISGISTLFEYKKNMLLKIRNVLKIFNETQEKIVPLWRPQRITEDIREGFDSDLLAEYESIIEEFARKENGILDMSDRADMAVDLADAIYGDSDAAMMRGIELGKPVMIQNPEL